MGWEQLCPMLSCEISFLGFLKAWQPSIPQTSTLSYSGSALKETSLLWSKNSLPHCKLLLLSLLPFPIQVEGPNESTTWPSTTYILASCSPPVLKALSFPALLSLTQKSHLLVQWLALWNLYSLGEGSVTLFSLLWSNEKANIPLIKAKFLSLPTRSRS